MKKLLLFTFSLFLLGSFMITYGQEPPSYMSPNSLEGHGDDEDFDNDGVINIIDLDKDNDGILDADECDVSTTAREFNIIAPPIYRTMGFIYWILNIKGTPSTLVEFNGNNYQISASGTLTITLESQDIPIAINNSPQENQVLRLIAEEPVSIIQELASLNNADAWTVIPEKLWGTQYRLFSEYGSNQDNYQYAMIVSNSEDNEILIKNKNGIVQEGFTLNQGQTFLLRQNNTDLNGWTVESNKPVGVVIGSGCVSTPNGCDSMFEMLTPIQFLGEKYYLPNMTENKTFVMAEYANTTVSLNGSIVSTLSLAGDVFEFTSSVNDKQIIETSQPATVWQMQDINGNPAWLKLFDENKAVQEFEFTIPNSNSLASKNKLHIVVPTAKTDEIRINGNTVLSSEWIPYPYDTDLSYCIKSELNPSSTWKVTSTSGLVPIIANYIGGSSGFTMSMAMTIGSYNVKSGAAILTNCQDTDGDGIPDYLDLDSDNDGCNDAYEAYGTLDLSFGNGQIVNVDVQGKIVEATYPGNHINVITPGYASTFITHPVDTTIELGGNITLTAEVNEGSGETFYQWQISIDNGTTWIDLLYDETYQNVLTETLVINNPTNEMNGHQFRLKTMQSDYVCGERVSNSATLCVVDKAIINDVNATCSVVVVQAQQPTLGTGSWSVISGEGGQFANPNAATTTFTGVSGNSYVIRWTVQNGSDACQSIAEYTIQNMPTAVPNAEVDNFNTCFSPDLTLASIPTNGQNIVWYDALINGNILPETTILTSGEIYYAVVANGECESLERTPLLVTLNNPSAPSGEVVQTFCLSQQATIEDLVVNGNDIQWYTQLSGGVPLDSNTLLQNNTTYYASQKIDGCESYARLAVQVQLTVVDIPTSTNTTPLFCVQENATLASIPIDQNNIVWYDQAVGGNILNSSTLLVHNTTYYAAHKIGDCESVDRLAITPSIQTTPAPIVERTTVEYCQQDDMTVADLGASGAGTLVYYFNGTTVNATDVLQSGVYTVKQIINGCESINGVTVNVTIHNTPAPTGEITQSFCEMNNPTVADLVAAGTTSTGALVWYGNPNLSTPLALTEALIDGSTYYAVFVDNDCPSAIPLAVTVSISEIDMPNISAVAELYCSDEIVSLGQLGVTGQNLKWFNESGAEIPATTMIANGETYYVSQTIGECESARASFTIHIQTTPAPTVERTTVEYCQQDDITVADLGASGAGTLVYYFNGTTVNATDVLQSGVYTVKQIINGCESVDEVTVNVTIHNTPAPTGETTQSFCEMNNPTVADLVVTGATTTGALVWYDNQNLSTPLASTEALVDGAIYYAVFVDNDCPSALSLAVTVSISEIAMPNISAVADLYCSDDIVSLGELGVIGQNLKWFNELGAEIPATTMIANGKTYYVSQTIGDCESARATFTINIQTTPAPTVERAEVAYCQPDGKTVADLGASGAGTLVYYFNGTTVNATDLLQSGVYTVKQIINGCESVDEVTVNVTIHNTPAPTGETTQSFCEMNNPTVADLVVTGATPTGALVWYGNQNLSTPLASTEALVDGTTYYAVFVDNNCPSATSLAVIVSISEIAMPNISAVADLYCSDDIVSLGELGVIGQNLKWFNELGAEIPATTMITNGETYYVSQTIGDCESARATFTINIQTTPAPTVERAEVAYCQPEGKTVADLGASGAGTLVYYFNGTTVNATDLLQSGVYTVKQIINDCESVDEVTVNVTIHNTPAPTGETTQSFCEMNNPTVADLVVNGTAVKWYASIDATVALPIDNALEDGVMYFASQTVNNCESECRLAVTVSINEILAPTIENDNPLFCIDEGATLADISVIGSNVRWYTSLTDVTPLLATTTLVDAVTYYATQTINGCESVERLAVTVQVQNTPAPTTTQSIQEFCIAEGATLSDLEITGEQIKWYNDQGELLPSTTLLINGTTYFASQTINTCESVERLAIEIVVYDTAAPTTKESVQSFCIQDDATLNDLVIDGENILWYNELGDLLPSTTLLENDTTYYATQTLNECESVEKLAIQVSVNETPSPTTDNTIQEFCVLSPLSLNELEIEGENIQWYSAAVGGELLEGTTIVIDGTTYYASQTINGCESVNRLAIQVAVKVTPLPILTPNQEFCVGDQATLASVLIDGENIIWYNAAEGGNMLPMDTILQNEVSYFASQTIDDCETISRVEYVAVVKSTPAPQLQNTIVYCDQDEATIADLPFQGQPIVWYDSLTATVPLANTTLLVTGTYYAAQIVEGCESVERTGIEVEITYTFPILPEMISTCSNSILQDVILQGYTFEQLEWYSSEFSTSKLSGYTILNASTILYVNTVNGNCRSERVPISIEMLPIVPQPMAPTQYICGAGTVADLVALGANGATINWYNSATADTPLSANTSLVNGTYYVSQTLGSCTSTRRAVQVIVVSTAAPIITEIDVCQGETIADVYVYTPVGSHNLWYVSPTATTPLDESTILINGTYYIERSHHGCVSERAAVQVNVHAIPNAPTGEAVQSIEMPGVVGDIVMNESNVVWYFAYESAIHQTGALSNSTPLINGHTYYGVLVSDAGCVSEPTGVTVNLYLDNESFDLAKLRIYPNPTTDFLNISYYESIDRVEVYSLLGQRLMNVIVEDTETVIDMTSLASSTYMVRIWVGESNQLVKVVKK